MPTTPEIYLICEADLDKKMKSIYVITPGSLRFREQNNQRLNLSINLRSASVTPDSASEKETQTSTATQQPAADTPHVPEQIKEKEQLIVLSRRVSG